MLRRWTLLFTGPVLVQRYRAGADQLPAEVQAVKTQTARTAYANALKAELPKEAH